MSTTPVRYSAARGQALFAEVTAPAEHAPPQAPTPSNYQPIIAAGERAVPTSARTALAPAAQGVRFAQVAEPTKPAGDPAIERARKDLRRLGEALMTTRSATGAYGVTSEIARIAREQPSLGEEALDRMGRAFAYMPFDIWYATITAIQDIAARDHQLTAAAYRTMATPFAIAEATLASGNIAAQQRAVEAIEQIASRMPGFVGRLFDDLVPLLANTDPFAADLSESVQTALVRFVSVQPQRAEQLFRPLQDRIEALLARQAKATADERPEEARYSFDELIARSTSSYSVVAAQSSEARAREALSVLGRVFETGLRRSSPAALYAMTRIGEGHATLAREVMQAIITRDAQLQDHDRVGAECLKALAKAHRSLAADVAHYFRDKLLSSNRREAARSDLRNLIAHQPEAAGYVIADMKALLATPHAPEAIKVLADLTWAVAPRRAEILAELASAHSRGTPGFDESVWRTIVPLAQSRPPLRPVVREMLQRYLQQLTAGDLTANAAKIAQVAQWLEQLNAPVSAVAND